MRIIGHVEHPVYKITVFKMDMRVSVQFEFDRYAQIYKYQNIEEVSSLAQVQALVTPQLLRDVKLVFDQMHQSNMVALASIQKNDEEAFDEII